MHDPIYVFLGKENALKEEALSDLKIEVLSGGNADLNCTVFYSDQIEPHEFQDAVNTQPFLSLKRFVVIRDIERLTQPVQDSITGYCKNPSKNTVLVLMSDMEIRDLDSRKGELFAVISGHARVRVFERLKEDKLNRYIRDKAVSNKKAITEEAVGLLLEKLGDDLANIKKALEGLVTYVGTRHKIEKDDVEVLIGKSLEETVFTLTKAICARQTAQSLSILSTLFRESVKPENIIGAIGAELRRLMKVKHLMAQGKNQWHIQSELRLNQRAVSEAMNIAKGIKLDDIKRSFDHLLKADRDCKNRDLDKRVILESLIVRLSDLGELA